MTQRKAIAVAALMALALGVLSPASSLATAGGTDRPVTGASSGTFSIDPRTGAVSGDVTGVASHLGKFSAHIEGDGAQQPDGTYAGSGAVTIEAANGDQWGPLPRLETGGSAK